MFSFNYRHLLILLLVAAVWTGGCSLKQASSTPALLATETAELAQLQSEVDRYARVTSMRAKMYLKFEDNSFAQFGSKEVYREADG